MQKSKFSKNTNIITIDTGNSSAETPNINNANSNLTLNPYKNNKIKSNSEEILDADTA